MKVTGRACDEIQEGSGWVAAPGLVVTNAHVVAGEQRDARCRTEPGARCRRRVVAFDPVRDVAVLAVPALDAAAAADRAGRGRQRRRGLRPSRRRRCCDASPARVGDEILAVGTDIYRTGTSRRHVYVLAAALAPGRLRRRARERATAT